MRLRPPEDGSPAPTLGSGDPRAGVLTLAVMRAWLAEAECDLPWSVMPHPPLGARVLRPGEGGPREP